MTVVEAGGRARRGSTSIGASLPFLLTRLGLDPAVASSPLIATIVLDGLGAV